MTILFVDDEPLIIQDLAKSIDREALMIDKILLAYSAKQAQAFFAQEPIHLVLCDVEMPQTNGLEFLSWVKENYPDTKSMIITGFSVFRYAQTALQLGCLDYLLKPISPEDLEKAIARVGKITLPLEEDKFQNLSTAVKQAILFILDNQSLALTRQEVASHVFLNPDYLDRKFKAETNMSITQYITTKKVEKAKDLLQNSTMSISEIAELAGYSNLANFSCMFKQVTGFTPSAYRKKHR